MGYNHLVCKIFDNWEGVKDEILLPERKDGSGNGTVHVFLGNADNVLRNEFSTYYNDVKKNGDTNKGAVVINHYFLKSNIYSMIGAMCQYCYAKKIDKDEAKADFSMRAEELCRKIRAFSPYPAVYFEHNGERFKILFAEPSVEKGSAGEILHLENCLKIACADGSINITKIQRQGKKAMDIAELLRGYSFF